MRKIEKPLILLKQKRGIQPLPDVKAELLISFLVFLPVFLQFLMVKPFFYGAVFEARYFACYPGF